LPVDPMDLVSDVVESSQKIAASIQNDRLTPDIYAEYTVAAKNLAAVAAEHLVKKNVQEFVGEQDDKNHTPEEMKSLARNIRSWLAPWNFAIMDSADQKTYRLDAVRKGHADQVAFELRQHGNPHGRKAKWSKVKEVLLSPNLVDATEILRNRQNSRS
jgi:hypothetical protein